MSLWVEASHHSPTSAHYVPLTVHLQAQKDTQNRTSQDPPAAGNSLLPSPFDQRGIQHAAMAQLLTDCSATREQRDTAVAELRQAAHALTAAEARSMELATTNEHLNVSAAFRTSWRFLIVRGVMEKGPYCV